MECFFVLKPVGALLGLFDHYWNWRERILFGKHFAVNGYGSLDMELVREWKGILQTTQPDIQNIRVSLVRREAFTDISVLLVDCHFENPLTDTHNTQYPPRLKSFFRDNLATKLEVPIE